MANRKSSRRNGSRARHSYSDYRRLSPDENERQGFSRTARHYVLKGVKRVTPHTPSISARAHETLRARQLHGLASPEQATTARREGGISYSGADQASRVEKAADRRLTEKVRESVGEYLPTSSPRRKRTRFHFTNERMKNFERNRERKLRGEWLDNGEWFENVVNEGGESQLGDWEYAPVQGGTFLHAGVHSMRKAKGIDQNTRRRSETRFAKRGGGAIARR